MIEKNQNVELFLSTFFFLSKEEAKKISNIFEQSKNFKYNNFRNDNVDICFYLERFKVIKSDITMLPMEDLEKIAVITLAEEFILRNLHMLLMDEESYKKLESVVKRKQFESKVLKDFKNYLCYIFSSDDDSMNRVLEFICFSMKPRLDKNIDELENEFILFKYKRFRDEIEKICPGISKSVYMNLNTVYGLMYDKDFLEEVNNYFIKKYNYDYCKANDPFKYLDKKNFQYSEYILLSHLNDYETISLFRGKEVLFDLFYLITKYNSFSYVMKIIDFLMANLQKKYKDYKLVIENNLPLHLLDSDYLIKKSQNTFFGFFGVFKQYDLGIIRKYENNMLLLEGVSTNILKKGKSLLANIISEIYPKDYKKVMTLFSKPNTKITFRPYSVNETIQKIESVLSFTEYLDRIYSYDEKYKAESKYLELKYNYFSEENTFNRICYKVFILNELDSKSIYSMFHTLYGRILMIQGFESKYQLNTSKKDEKYSELKKILANYNLELSDNYKQLYITALLDEKVASFEEVEIYKQLEQKGDSIYQLVCNEILFYKNEEDNFTTVNLDNMIKAESQIEVAKKISLDKLYITTYLIDETSDLIDSQITYLADSLEMVIGAISIEFGVETAFSFTHRLLESKLDKISEYEFENNIDYHAKCFPSCNEIDLDESGYYYHLGKSLKKFVLCYCYGNSNVEKRNEIAKYHTLKDISYKDDEIEYTLYPILIREYLFNGIQFIFNKYKDKILLK